MFIRKAKVEDLDGILELYQYLFKFENYIEPKDFEIKWDEILNHKGLQYFVAVVNSSIVASCNISITPNLSRGQRSYALIENVITHPMYRRKGYGKAVLMKAVNFAKEVNCYKVMLLSTSSEARAVAHKFYEDLGFDGNSKRGFFIRFS